MQLLSKIEGFLKDHIILKGGTLLPSNCVIFCEGRREKKMQSNVIGLNIPPGNIQRVRVIFKK